MTLRPAPPSGFTYSWKLQPFATAVDSRPLFVTYHTSGPDGGGYEREAVVLVETLVEFGCGARCLVLDGGPRTSWRAATMRKPEVIVWALETFGVPIVWLDADACVRAPMTLFDEWPGGDLGIRMRPIDMAHPDRVVWCGGTVWWGATDAARGLARAWRNACASNACARDADSEQEILGMLATNSANAGRMTIRNLPPAYYWYDKDRERHPDVEPVIEHLHASRTRAQGRVDGWRWYEKPTNGVLE